RFADGSHDVAFFLLSALKEDRLDLVVASVKGGTDQIIHGPVDKHELPGGSFFCVDGAGDKKAGISHDDPAGLKDQFKAQTLNLLEKRLGVLLRRGGSLVLVSDSKTSAQVKIAEGKAGVRDFPDHLLELFQGVHKGTELGELAADMAVQALDLQ